MKIIIFDGTFKTTTFINNLICGLSVDNEVFVLGFNEYLDKPIKNVCYVSLGSNSSKTSFIFKSLAYSFKGGYFYKFMKSMFSLDKKSIQKWNLNYQINKIKPDIIHLQWFSNIVWFEKYLNHPSFKFVISFRGYHINVRPFIQFESRLYLHKYIPFFNGIHGVSETILSNLEKLEIPSEHQIKTTIYSGHYIPNIKSTRSSWNLNLEPVFLLIGRNHWKKNYSLIISLAKKMKDYKMSFKFRFVGLELNDSEEILFLTKHYNLEHYLEFIPNQSPDKLKDVYLGADALILPSLEEGIANVCIEAMSYRLPVIASDVGGMNELIQSGVSGILVQDISVDGFYKALKLFLRMSDKDKENMVNKGYETVKTKFSSKKMIKDFNSFYKTVLDV